MAIKRARQLSNYRPPQHAVRLALRACIGLFGAWIVRLLYEQYLLATAGLEPIRSQATWLDRGFEALTYLVLGAGVYFWCTWQVRALTNEAALRPKKRNHTPTETLLFYLIPVISLHRPFEVIMTILRDSEAHLDDDRWGQYAKYVGVWWLALWLGILLYGMGYAYVPSDWERPVTRVIAELQIANGFFIAAAVVLSASAFAAIRMIAHINALQAEFFTQASEEASKT